MSIEGGSSAGSGAAPGGGIGPVGGPSISVGIEGGGLIGAATVSGLARFDQGPTLVPFGIGQAFGAVPLGQKPMGTNGFSEYGNLADFKANGPAAFGLEAQALSAPVSSDILGSISFLKNSVPLYQRKSDPVAEAVKQSKPKEVVPEAGLNEVEAVTIQAERVVAGGQAAAVPEINYILVKEKEENPLVSVHPAVKTAASPALESLVKTEKVPGVKVATESKTGAATAVKPAEAVKTETAVKQEEETEVITEEKTEEEEEKIEEEELRRIKRKYVVDEKALKQLIIEFKEAVIKAKKLALKLGIKLTGDLISKLVPGQNNANESEAVKGKGPDGSIPERQEAIGVLGEFSSETQAIKRLIKEAYEKPPVKISTEGNEVKDEDVARVYKYHLSKPKAVAEVVSSESKIEDYPQLAEVFQKAA